MHVAQVNFVPAPAALSVEALFERWTTLADIPEAVAGCGIRVSVWQAAACEAQIHRRGVDYHFVDTRQCGDALRTSRLMAARLAASGAEVWHVHGLDFARQAWMLSQHPQARPLLMQDHANRPPRRWRRGRWRRWYASAAGMAFTSREQAEPFLAAELLPAGLPLYEIPESSCRFQPGSRRQARLETGLYGEPCLLTVGHLQAGKDPLTLLDGVAKVMPYYPGMQLWWVFGRAPMHAQVRRRIERDPRLRGRVHLLGAVPHAQVEVLMRAADVFISASRAESCGYAAMEAMACGAWPLLSDIPAFRTLSAGGRCGRLWPPGQSQRLAEVLHESIRTPAGRTPVRAHFERHLSFAAVGARWVDAYAHMRGADRCPPR